MPSKSPFRNEAVFILILALLGLGMVVASLDLGFGTLKKPGPGLFPFLAAVIILSHSLLLLLFTRRSKNAGSFFARDEINTFLFMTGTFVLWLILIPLAGYLLITFLATFSLSKIMRLAGWRKPLILSAATTGLCYFLFDYFLYSDLPRGFLG